MRIARLLVGLVAATMLVLAAGCGDNDDDGDGADTASDGNGAAATSTNGDDGNGAEAPSGTSGRGSATLTIGDQTWTFDNYYCARGSDETRNDRVSFSSGARGESDGVRIQLDASIQDPSEDDRLEGDGVIHSITLDDIDDFENPSVSWSAVSGIVGGGASFIKVGDGTVSAEATFDDGRTDGVQEEVAGTLEATCGQ